MALWKPFRGNRTALDVVEKHDGYVYFCVDDGTLFFDYVDANGNLQRKQINAKEAETIMGYDIGTIVNNSTTEIPTSKAVQDYVGNSVATISPRIAALEAIDHEHGNKTVLDSITSENVSTWDSALQEITTTANGGLKVTNKNQIDIDDSVLFFLDCGTSNSNVSNLGGEGTLTVENNEAGGQTASIG